MLLTDTFLSKKNLQKAFLVLWIAISCAAIIGMFHLWWSRERVLYWGKDVTTQRIEVFKYAGIPISILTAFQSIDSYWPAEITYRASGNHNKLSYLKYLLIPRMPSGSDKYQVRSNGKTIKYTHLSPPAVIKRFSNETPSAFGWILSLLLFWGIGLAFTRALNTFDLNVPETWGLCCLSLMILSILSVILLNRADYAHTFFSIIGIFGWISYWSRPGKKSDFHSGLNRFQAGMHLNRQSAYLLILWSIGLLFFLWSLLMAVAVVPDDWDAWAIWGAKAKVLALSHGPLKNVTYFGHPDYPLLWPAVWALSGWCSGGWEEHWSKGWGPLFMLLTAWQIFLIVRQESDNVTSALIAAVMFLSIPMVSLIASWSYAEAPLWLMITCCFGRLLRWRKLHLKQDLIICGVFASAAAYTKNEGLFFALLAFFWILGSDIQRWRECLVYYLVPVIILYGPWFYWTRLEMTMGSHALTGVAVGMKRIGEAATHQGAAALFTTVLMYLRKILDAFYYIGKIWLDIKQWNVILAFALFSSAYQFVVGTKTVRMDLTLPLFLFLGYLFLTVLHFHSLGYQIGASWNRLTLHIIPLLLIVIHINGSGYLMKKQ